MIETFSSIHHVHENVIKMTTSKKDFILIILEAESYKNKIQDGRPRASYLGKKNRDFLKQNTWSNTFFMQNIADFIRK